MQGDKDMHKAFSIQVENRGGYGRIAGILHVILNFMDVILQHEF